MIELPNVTLVCVSSVEIDNSIRSLRNTSKYINFAHVKFITHVDVGLESEIEVVNCKQIESIDEYSRFIIFDLHSHIDTDFCMIVQHDSFIRNSHLWSNEFLNYDYIGAPWPRPGELWMPDHRYMNSDGVVLDSFDEKYRVGNGGFSIRSKKLLTTPTRFKIPFEDRVSSFGYFHTFNEDWNICIYNRHLYERDGNTFAPFEVANMFSKEWAVHETFAQHRYS